MQHETPQTIRSRIRRTGLWAAARWAAKRGVPIEVVLAAIRPGL